MSASDDVLRVNGWALYAHPCFTQQFNELFQRVEKLREKHPTTYQQKAVTKRLRAVLELTMDRIPQNPAHPNYRQGKTLDASRKHWFRAKFFQQYRLFFRFDSQAKVIVYAWVNDAKTKRAYDSKTDAYRVFSKMLDRGHPPDNWDELLKEAAAWDGKGDE